MSHAIHGPKSREQSRASPRKFLVGYLLRMAVFLGTIDDQRGHKALEAPSPLPTRSISRQRLNRGLRLCQNRILIICKLIVATASVKRSPPQLALFARAPREDTSHFLEPNFERGANDGDKRNGKYVRSRVHTTATFCVSLTAPNTSRLIR